MRETLEQLKRIGIFTTVVKCGSFTGAGKQLQISRSKVSEHISTLEKVLDVRLFQRSTRKLTITVEGQQFYQQTAQLLTMADTAIAQAKASSHDLKGRLKVSCPHDLAQDLLAPFLRQFGQLHPEVELYLDVQDQPVDLLDDNVDIALRVGSPKASSLVGQVLAKMPLYLVASADYLARNGTPQTLEELHQHRGIGIEPLGRLSSLTMVNTEGETRALPLGEHYHSQSPRGATLMAQQGLGITLKANFVSNINNTGLVRVLPQWNMSGLVLSLLYPSRRELPARTRGFIDQFKLYIAAQEWN
ncbi:LysR family transcriptional regulator [Shewanella youngdeokensis]|uniref:LysR substrate-binding domain-containing protein n=1 Tax=Shewanella youngdeokensis TaxID=2999068 RepID=A0ABZ0K1I2_9GAMM|nr:LysR substrate-binding domain-containing protein [Shewanella sp. DAU334]